MRECCYHSNCHPFENKVRNSLKVKSFSLTWRRDEQKKKKKCLVKNIMKR